MERVRCVFLVFDMERRDKQGRNRADKDPNKKVCRLLEIITITYCSLIS